MARTKEELLAELARCVVEMEDEAVVPVAEEYAAAGYDPQEGILNGLVVGMNQAADLYDQEEYYIPELLICSEAMYNGLAVFRPLLPQEKQADECKIVIGVVQGDTHDIGKNLVKIMLEAAGFTMIDLGRDVPVEKFVDAVREENARVVALSTLMSTSMQNMGKVVDLLQEAGLRDKVKVIIGGGPVSTAFANKIGADGYAINATDAVHLVRELLGA